MQIRFTKHAEARMKERRIVRRTIEEAILHPHVIQASTKSGNRFIVKTLHWQAHRKHLLMIIFEKHRDTLLVITIIDTSKINKYY